MEYRESVTLYVSGLGSKSCLLQGQGAKKLINNVHEPMTHPFSQDLIAFVSLFGVMPVSNQI